MDSNSDAKDLVEIPMESSQMGLQNRWSRLKLAILANILAIS